MKKWKKFTVLDVAAFKLYLFSLGALFGMNAVKSRRNAAPFFQFLALLTFGRMVWRMFLADRGEWD